MVKALALPSAKWIFKSEIKAEDGGGIGQGDHFLPNKFIKRTFKHWINSKKLLNAGRGYQAPRKSSPLSSKGDVLSMVLYRRISLETTVKISLKTRSRRRKSEPWEHQRTPDSREHYSAGAHQTPPYLHWIQAPTKGQQVPKQDIPYKFSSNPGTQPWASIYRLPKVTPKSLTSHNSLLDTSLHSREKKPSSTHQNTDTSFPNQETLTSHPKPWQSHPQQGNSTIKRTLQTARIQKGHPKHSNINKMKRQRNTQQVKEQDKCPPNQTKEEEIRNLPVKYSK